jgi:hypothetical protein
VTYETVLVVSSEIDTFFYFDMNGNPIRTRSEFEYTDEIDGVTARVHTNLDIRYLAIGDEVAVVELPEEADDLPLEEPNEFWEKRFG